MARSKSFKELVQHHVKGDTQTKLAASAGLGLSTVVDFEKERRQVSPESVDAIRRALVRVGIEFIDENGGGPGVRLHKRQRPKQSK